MLAIVSGLGDFNFVILRRSNSRDPMLSDVVACGCFSAPCFEPCPAQDSRGVSRCSGTYLQSLTVRNYAGNIPITALSQVAFDPAASLQFIFDGQPWGSTISFAPGISVTLGGELDLDAAPTVNLASLVGDTFKLFDWTGVSPIGLFNIVADHGWDVSQLYTTGKVTYVGVPEPSMFALLGMGAMSLLAYARRRRSIRTAVTTAALIRPPDRMRFAS